MKLSLIVTSLLISSSLMFSGCGSDDDNNTGTTNEITTPTTGGEETTKVYTTDILKSLVAGKTIYSYGYDRSNMNEKSGENRVKLVFSEDGTKVNAFDIDSDKAFGDASSTFSDNRITLLDNGNIIFTYNIITDNTDGIYVYVNDDLYPNVFAYKKQEDKASSLLKNFAESTVVTKDTIIKKQYGVTIQEEQDDITVGECTYTTFQDKTFTKNTLAYSMTASYTIDGNIINITVGEQSGSSEVLGLTQNVMITLLTDDNGHYFSNYGFATKQNAIDFSLIHGKDCSSDFNQLEQP